MKKLLPLCLLAACAGAVHAADFSPEDNACQAPCTVQDQPVVKADKAPVVKNPDKAGKPAPVVKAR